MMDKAAGFNRHQVLHLPTLPLSVLQPGPAHPALTDRHPPVCCPAHVPAPARLDEVHCRPPLVAPHASPQVAAALQPDPRVPIAASCWQVAECPLQPWPGQQPLQQAMRLRRSSQHRARLSKQAVVHSAAAVGGLHLSAGPGAPCEDCW